jgi:hypothetical protein
MPADPAPLGPDLFLRQESTMKTGIVALFGIGLFAGVFAGVWLSTDSPANTASYSASQSEASDNPERTASADSASSFWYRGEAGNSKTALDKTHKSLNILLGQALRASSVPAGSDDPREQLRKLAKDDPAVMKQLMQGYDKQTNSQTRQLIVSLLSSVEKPEVLAFSKRLSLSSDMDERKDGFAMLQNRSGDSPEVRAIILQGLSGEKTPEVIMLALGALKPPGSDGNNPSQTNMQVPDAAAIVAQLQKLSTNADADIRLQSILQLAEWDKSGSSQAQWSQALRDQSPQVRQAAVTAIAQSGIQSEAVKAALLGVANNPEENKDVRGAALQVLERFTLSKEEAANSSHLRSQILGL